MSSAHEEIRDEGEERGVETVDRREICQEGECHAWKEQKPFHNCHVSHDNILKNTKAVLYTEAGAATTSIRRRVSHRGLGERRPTLRNLNGAGADPADDITQQVFFHFVLGKPAQHRQMSE